MTAARASWIPVRLDRVARRGSGHTPDRKRPAYWNGTIKWLSLKDSDRLDNLYVADTCERITPAGIAHSSAVEHPAGTVVLSRDAGVGRSAITKDVMAVSQHFIAWQCGPRLDNHFLYYWLQYQKPEFERIAIGNTIKTIGLPYFRALAIPLPPLDEQQRIASVLRDADALIAVQDRVLAKHRDRKQAIMQQLLGGHTRLPGFAGPWHTRRLGELGALFKGKGIRKDDIQREGLPCLRYGEIYTHHDDILRAFHSYITPEVARASCRLEAGDVVFAASGETAEDIGKCVAFLGDHEAYVGSDTLVLRTDGHDARFLGYLLNRPEVAAQKARLGQGDAIVHLGAHHLAGVTVRLPDRPEQAAIAAVLLDLDAELAALARRRDKTRRVKHGMMQALLSGTTRLRSSPPSRSPAPVAAASQRARRRAPGRRVMEPRS